MKKLSYALLLLGFFALAACGGSSDGSDTDTHQDDTDNNSSTTTTTTNPMVDKVLSNTNGLILGLEYGQSIAEAEAALSGFEADVDDTPGEAYIWAYKTIGDNYQELSVDIYFDENDRLSDVSVIVDGSEEDIDALMEEAISIYTKKYGTPTENYGGADGADWDINNSEFLSIYAAYDVDYNFFYMDFYRY